MNVIPDEHSGLSHDSFPAQSGSGGPDKNTQRRIHFQGVVLGSIQGFQNRTM